MANPTLAPAPVHVDSGDHERFAHYCRKADVVRAYVEGASVLALCGKRWVPTRDPEAFPICQSCVEAYAAGRRFPT